MNKEKFTKFQRKTLIVKKGLQYRFVLLVLVSLITGVFLILADLGLVFYRISQTSPALITKLTGEIMPYLPMTVFKMLIYMTIVFVIALVFSHRIAGPVYKIEKSAQLVGNGDLSFEVYYRNGDRLNSLKTAFNFMIKNLRSLVISDRKKAAEIATELSETARTLENKELAAKLNALSEKASTISKAYKL